MSYTIFNVQMLSSEDHLTCRPVKVPNDRLERMEPDVLPLGLIFYYGQNDHQPSEIHCSVSVGDVIELPRGDEISLWLVCPVGCREITAEEHAEYLTHSARDRKFHPLVRGK